MSAASESQSPTNLIKTLLGVKRDEYAAVAWSFAYFFCVLSSYYVLRPIREEMAVGGDPTKIPYLFIGTFFVSLIASSIFGWITSRYPRRVFLPWVYLFFVINILIFWALFTTRLENDYDTIWLGRTYFVWLSVFNLFVVSVFWSFMADIYTREQGRRLFGLITAGGSLGGVLGPAATSHFVTTIGYQNLFPIAAVILSLAILCLHRLRRAIKEDQASEAPESTGRPLGGSTFDGISHVFRTPYFLGIGASSIIASLLGTALYMWLAFIIQGEISDSNERVQFFSNMNLVQNIIAMFTQLFVVRLVVARLGLSTSLALMPAISILGFAVLAMDPTLMGVAILTVVRRGLGFGFTKPSTDMLYSVVSPEDKYKAKNFIDVPIYRGGDLFGTWTIKLFMAPIIGLTWVGISALMVPFAVLWTGIAVWLGRDYRRRAKSLKESGIA